VQSLEFASVQAKVFDALKAGSEALQKLTRETSVEDIERLMAGAFAAYFRRRYIALATLVHRHAQRAGILSRLV
jgi:hypothetical protein